MESDKKRYVYSFTAWPDETRNRELALYDLFRALGSRIEMTFHEHEFHKFKQGLLIEGITLREVERLPSSHLDI